MGPRRNIGVVATGYGKATAARVRRGTIPLVAVVGLLFVGAGAAVAETSPGAEDDFVARIANERVTAGLAGYAVAPDLVDVARRHAEEMARQDRLFHNPRLATDVKDWDSVGENVGKGATVAEIHRAFMESSTHRSEILSRRFTQVGVGVVERDGVIWVAQVFRQPSSPAPEPAPAPRRAAPPAATSASTTTTTTKKTTTTFRVAVVTTIAPTVAPTTTTTTTEPAVTTTSTLAASEPTLPFALEVSSPDRPPVAVASSLRPRPTATLRDVTSPMAAASTLLVLVVGALAAQVAVESRRTAGDR